MGHHIQCRRCITWKQGMCIAFLSQQKITNKHLRKRTDPLLTRGSDDGHLILKLFSQEEVTGLPQDLSTCNDNRLSWYWLMKLSANSCLFRQNPAAEFIWLSVSMHTTCRKMKSLPPFWLDAAFSLFALAKFSSALANSCLFKHTWGKKAKLELCVYRHLVNIFLSV